MMDRVDLVWIGTLGLAELCAAVGFAGAILFVTTSVSISFSDAAGALVARAPGEGRPKTSQ